jgi:hypothetical protein
VKGRAAALDVVGVVVVVDGVVAGAGEVDGELPPLLHATNAARAMNIKAGRTKVL